MPAPPSGLFFIQEHLSKSSLVIKSGAISKKSRRPTIIKTHQVLCAFSLRNYPLSRLTRRRMLHRIIRLTRLITRMLNPTTTQILI